MSSLNKIKRFAQLALVLPLSVSVACDDRAEPRVTTHQQDSEDLHEDPAEGHSLHEPFFFDPQSATMIDPHRVGTADAFVRIDVRSIDEAADQRQARFDIETPTGARFIATVSQRILRDGAEEVVVVEDVETGATVSCAFGAEHAILTAEDGSQALIEGDDDIEQVVSTAQDGSQLMFDYQGVVEGSAEEDDLNGILTLTMLGQAELSEDQMAALAATTAAAEEVIGSADMGWGWAKNFVKKVVKTVQAVLCHDATKVICNVAGTGGQAVVTICAKAACPPEATVTAGVIAAVGKACTAVQTAVCD